MLVEPIKYLLETSGKLHSFVMWSLPPVHPEKTFRRNIGSTLDKRSGRFLMKDCRFEEGDGRFEREKSVRPFATVSIPIAVKSIWLLDS